MRVLGVDIGLKRTGLALSDETGIAVTMLPNLYAKNQVSAAEKILTLIHEFSVKIVIIGRPQPKTKGSIAIASRATAFKKKLDEVIKSAELLVQVILWDEDLTSRIAMKHLISAGVPQKKRKLMLDSASAAIMVEDFLKALDKQ